MKNELIKRNILITVVTSIIFILLSFFIISYYSKKSLEEELINISSLYSSYIENDLTQEDISDSTNKFTKNQTWISISVANKDGLIFVDSSDDSIGTVLNNIYLKDEEINISNNILEKDRFITSNNTIYYYFVVGNNIIRFKAEYKISTSYILLSIFVMLILLIGEILISYLLSQKTSKNVTKTFKNIEDNLISLNSSEFKSSTLSSEYEEVEPIVKEINKINHNLNRSFIKLENERNKLLLVVNKLNEGIIVLDDSLNIILINDSASNILSIDKTKSLGVSFETLFSDNNFIQNIKESLNNKTNTCFDYKNNDDGKIYYVNSAYLSISWESVTQINNVLFITLNDVTVDRRASIVKSNFISNASHELKTPITSIKGFVELLSINNKSFDEKTNRYIDVIKNESNRMGELIDELIYLSKLEEMDKNIDKEKVYLKDITFDIFESLNNSNPLNIKLINDCDNSYIIANPTLIFRLLKNLIENAYKYNKTNGLVTVRSKSNDRNIILEVIDTGIGIEKKNLDRIFERFYRVDKSRSSLIEGTGLGLNIVKETCELLNAKVDVDSEINIGTTFTITFKNTNN